MATTAGRTPEGLAAELEHALAEQLRHGGAVGAAWGHRARRCERELREILWRSGEPVEHGGRLYAIGEDGGLRVTVPYIDEEVHVGRD